MAHDPIPDPDGDGMLVDLGCSEGRTKAFLQAIRHSAKHHDDARSAIECAFTNVLHDTMVELIASASGLIGEAGEAYASPIVENVLTCGQVPLYRLVLVGEAAGLCAKLHNGEPIEEEFIVAGRGH